MSISATVQEPEAQAPRLSGVPYVTPSDDETVAITQVAFPPVRYIKQNTPVETIHCPRYVFVPQRAELVRTSVLTSYIPSGVCPIISHATIVDSN